MVYALLPYFYSKFNKLTTFYLPPFRHPQGIGGRSLPVDKPVALPYNSGPHTDCLDPANERAVPNTPKHQSQ